jgi:hypothetical protein
VVAHYFPEPSLRGECVEEIEKLRPRRADILELEFMDVFDVAVEDEDVFLFEIPAGERVQYKIAVALKIIAFPAVAEVHVAEEYVATPAVELLFRYRLDELRERCKEGLEFHIHLGVNDLITCIKKSRMRRNFDENSVKSRLIPAPGPV